MKTDVKTEDKPAMVNGDHDGNETDTASADQLLASFGYKPELLRNRSTFQVAFMSFVLASVPYGLATTLYYPLVCGGPVDIIWGWVAVSLIIICVAASLGEITSVYPTAGGVYYQAFMLAPASYRRVSAWICGWLYVVGNISITLSVNFATALFLVGCVNVFETAEGEGVLAGTPYQVFLIFLGITLLCNALCALCNKWLPILDVRLLLTLTFFSSSSCGSLHPRCTLVAPSLNPRVLTPCHCRHLLYSGPSQVCLLS
jgi:amino acid permease